MYDKVIISFQFCVIDKHVQCLGGSCMTNEKLIIIITECNVMIMKDLVP